VLAQQSESSVARVANEIVANFRRVIVLMEDDPSLDAAKKERTVILARMLFEQDVENLEGLRASVVADPVKLSAFLDRLETSSDYHDADKLAFRDLLEDLNAEPVRGATPAIQKRIADDIAALAKINALYEKELGQVLHCGIGSHSHRLVSSESCSNSSLF